MKNNIKSKVVSLLVALGIMFTSMPSYAAISVARAFYELAQQKNIQKIRLLQDRGYSVESVDRLGYNAVCLAVARQDKLAYKVLVSIGAKENPKCLDKIPEESYRRFFGSLKSVSHTPVYKSDTPYMVGAVALGAGALITAYALRGGSSGGSKSSDNNDDENLGDEEQDNKEDKVECPKNSKYNDQTKKCECVAGYGNYGQDDTCYKKLEGCIKQQENTCIICNSAFFELKNGICERTSCPEYSQYNNATKKCECKSGYENYGDEEACYKTILKCEKQEKNICTKCIEYHEFIGGECTFTGTCPLNSSYDEASGKCKCNSGYINQDNQCYIKIENCTNQDKDICKTCETGYVLVDGVCYREIPNCEEQIGDKCIDCSAGYDIYGGDGSQCYQDIVNCDTQIEDKCSECVENMGTHNDPAQNVCYQDVPNCSQYSSFDREKCLVCNPGFDTYGDPDGICYSENQCAGKGANVVPNNGECICDYINGYTGEPGNCSQAKEGEYQEGEGSVNQWTNFSAIYCNSKGKYVGKNHLGEPICECYASYGGPSCSECAEGYVEDGGRCFEPIDCSKVAENMIQSQNTCVCNVGFVEFEVDGQRVCSSELTCGDGMYQSGPDTCDCKKNFEPIDPEDLSQGCICPTDKGFVLDEMTQMCIKEEEEENCDEKNINGDVWGGAPTCDICPSQYAIIEMDGVERCGFECAANRQVQYDEEGNLVYNENGTLNCDSCADGFVYNQISGNCDLSTCILGKDEDGNDILKEGYTLSNGVSLPLSSTITGFIPYTSLNSPLFIRLIFPLFIFESFNPINGADFSWQKFSGPIK